MAYHKIIKITDNLSKLVLDSHFRSFEANTRSFKLNKLSSKDLFIFAENAHFMWVDLDRNADQYKQLIACSCHVTYVSQSESTLYSCLNVKELLPRNRREIWRLSDCNWTWTQSHLVRKWTIWPVWVRVHCSRSNILAYNKMGIKLETR